MLVKRNLGNDDSDSTFTGNVAIEEANEIVVNEGSEVCIVLCSLVIVYIYIFVVLCITS